MHYLFIWNRLAHPQRGHRWGSATKFIFFFFFFGYQRPQVWLKLNPRLPIWGPPPLRYIISNPHPMVPLCPRSSLEARTFFSPLLKLFIDPETPRASFPTVIETSLIQFHCVTLTYWVQCGKKKMFVEVQALSPQVTQRKLCGPRVTGTIWVCATISAHYGSGPYHFKRLSVLRHTLVVYRFVYPSKSESSISERWHRAPYLWNWLCVKLIFA